ncbi:multicopper oxidase family protein [Speluncibacter jeojiensis]|uniref:multicopper oxidase family protein n=1 Tax=Speluncibacter jeojiensis TaxID=2710754 RepID=UPI002410892D|nr:multicopper oxidase domain-containing protein [Rhodococcus sp. D2-41]
MTHPLDRRTVLRGFAAGAAGIALSSRPSGTAAAAPVAPANPSPLIFHSPPMAPFVDELPPLPVIGGSRLDIDAVSATHRFHRDFAPAPTLAYSGMDYLGPTIEAQRGAPTTVRFVNRITTHPLASDMDMSLSHVTGSDRTDPPTSFHMHGGATPPDSDGNPMQLSRRGQGNVHHFPNSQEAAHLWYHDHAMGITRLNVYAGLAGTYLLRDEFDTGRADNPLGLPAGEFELPMVLQEKIFTADGRQSGRSTPIVPQGGWEGGAVGDVGLVNGVVWPQLTVARGLYRLRLINAASFSVWHLFFSNRMRFWVIGTDGGLLDAPVPTTSLRLTPAERVDILVDFGALAPGTTVELRNDERPPFQAAILGEVAMPLFCRFRVGHARGFTGGVPTRLRGGPRLPAPLPPVERPHQVRNLTISQPYELRDPPAIMTLNNLRYSDPQIEMPRQGATEVWNLINITPDPHPIHIHLVMFRVLGRRPLRTVDYQLAHPQPPVGIKWTPSPEGFYAGPLSPPAPWEAGWKDTVRVDGGTVTQIVVRFPTADELGFDPDATFSAAPTIGPPTPAPSAVNPMAPMAGMHDMTGHATTDRLQGYVWHCHLLDHEDHDMMLRYRTIA